MNSALLECISWLNNYCIDMRSHYLCSGIDEIIEVQASTFG